MSILDSYKAKQAEINNRIATHTIRPQETLVMQELNYRIAVLVNPAKDCFVATARVYPHYKDPVDCFLAEATASRSYLEDKPSVSPREWAQTAAVGIALRNAGFGLQFAMAGEYFLEDSGIVRSSSRKYKFPDTVTEGAPTEQPAAVPQEEAYSIEEPAVKELTREEKVEQAMKVPCPITKFKGMTLGEVLRQDVGAIKWLAEKFTQNQEIQAAAQTIRDYALSQVTA